MTMKENGSINWTPAVITGMVLIFILIAFVIVRINSLENISISGVKEITTITNPNPLRVSVSGVKSVIYFSKVSNPKKIYSSGVENLIYLCRGIHNPLTYESGVKNQLIYRSC